MKRSLFILSLGSLAMLAGCAGAQVKDAQKKIFQDLNNIVKYQDCEAICDQLKDYLEKQAVAQ